MAENERSVDRWIATAAALGFTGVAIGAFGAHGLRGMLADAADASERLGWWETGARYHLFHALAVAIVAWAMSRRPSKVLVVSAAAFVVGVLLFSGTLYAMALGGPRWLGAITPLGGTSLLIGWGCLFGCAIRKRS